MIDRKAKPIAPSAADPVELDDGGGSQREMISHLKPNDPDEPRQMINEEMLLRLVPIGRATLFRLMKQNKFPRGTFVSPNRRLWLASEIARWQREVDEHVPGRRRGKGRGRRVSPGSS